MIQTFVAHTREIDDCEVAIQEVLAQLPPVDELRANTVGILTCHYDFIYSGMVEALQAVLPYTILGSVTSAQATPEVVNTLLLTLMVLTSDDVVFRTSCSETLLEAPGAAVEAAYAAAALPNEKPALILPFAAFLPQNSGDEYVAVLSEASGRAPIFGTLSIDDTATFEHALMMYEGKGYRDKMAMLLMYGDVHPKFYIATLSKDKIIDRPSLITKSSGHVLEEVNGRPIAEFFAQLGLTEASEKQYAMSSIAFMIDYNDGAPLVSKVFVLMNEEQQGVFAGAMPEGSTMYMALIDKEDVLLTTGQAIDEAKAAWQNASGVLAFSCVTRYLSMGGDVLAELTLAKDRFGKALPFMLANSGGEICPTQVDDTAAINRFHNNSAIICVF